MSPVISQPRDRFTLCKHDIVQSPFALAEDVIRGLQATPKHLPCRHLYDAEGSLLFERICALAEYYPPQAESEILSGRAGELAELFDRDITLVDLGSGNAQKTRILIEAFHDLHPRLRYVPVDISSEMLEQTSHGLLEDFDGLEVHAVAGDYGEGIRLLRDEIDRPKLIVYLGSSIGNFERHEALQFLSHLAEVMVPGDRLLIGIDLFKPKAVLEPAYNDRDGVTARFNLNVLERINREFDADFDLTKFAHHAPFNEKEGRIEMHLVSLAEQTVRIDALDEVIDFAYGETIHTECSHKYRLAEIQELANDAGLEVLVQWQDSLQRFSVNVLTLPGDDGWIGHTTG